MPAGSSRASAEAATGRLLAVVLLLVGCAATFGVDGAEAVILPATTIDGPNAESLSVGGVAMAPDGTGGLVYTKTVEGKPHVFASRYDGSAWSPPIRVDSEWPYEASEPRIAAGEHGRLLVVWVAPVATLGNGDLRRALFSAALGAGADGFGPQLVVDPNIQNGVGATPSLAGAAPGKAIVTYRVVTHSFTLLTEAAVGVQLRPGDVLADVRVARLEGDRWSRLGAINRNSAASMRPPDALNGPKVAIGATGRAAVAWQEPNTTGTAQVLVRRVTGTTLGPIFVASPETYGGAPVADDATAFAVAVTPTDRVRVASRVDGAGSSTLGGQRIFLTTLGSSASPEGATLRGPEVADGGARGGPVGPPALAVADNAGSGGAVDLAFATAGAVQRVGVQASGSLLAPAPVPGPLPAPATVSVAAVDPDGGGVNAYLSLVDGTLPTVAVRQELPDGGVQSAALRGPLGGSIAQLSGAGSGRGDALVAFRQGESGRFAIVADRIAAPPGAFAVSVPEGWVAPRAAHIDWSAPSTSVGGLTYRFLVEGREARSGIQGLQLTAKASEVGSGVVGVAIEATDRLGGIALSETAKLRVDGEAPRVRIGVARGRRAVSVRLLDADSGLRKAATKISFGDGTRQHGGAVSKHTYGRAGTYTIVVRAADRVGNRLTERVRVAVG